MSSMHGMSSRASNAVMGTMKPPQMHGHGMQTAHGAQKTHAMGGMHGMHGHDHSVHAMPMFVETMDRPGRKGQLVQARRDVRAMGQDLGAMHWQCSSGGKLISAGTVGTIVFVDFDGDAQIELVASCEHEAMPHAMCEPCTIRKRDLRHFRVVQRVIGDGTKTGGSSMVRMANAGAMKKHGMKNPHPMAMGMSGHGMKNKKTGHSSMVWQLSNSMADLRRTNSKRLMNMARHSAPATACCIIC